MLKIEEPTWTIDAPIVNMELSQYPKAQIPAQQYKALFTEMITRNFSTWERIYTDGYKSAEGVEAAAVCGEVVRDKALPQQTLIYTAEVCAIIIINENNVRKAVIFSDSCRAVTKMETIQFDDQVMRQLQRQIYANRKTGHQIQICWISGHCNITGNEKVDLAAKQAAKRVPTLHPLPYTDFYPVIWGMIRGQWASAWERSGDKLRKIKNNVRPWSRPRLQRRDYVRLTRLRSGHTNFSHGHLTEGVGVPAPPCPYCGECMVTIKHVHRV